MSSLYEKFLLSSKAARHFFARQDYTSKASEYAWCVEQSERYTCELGCAVVSLKTSFFVHTCCQFCSLIMY